MARSTEEIYQAMVDEKETLSSLDALEPNPETVQDFKDALNSTSKVSIWRLLFWVVAYMQHIQETLWDTKEKELETIQANTPPHTKLWWDNICYAFQYGDATVVDSAGRVGYETVDEDKQIISRANVKTGTTTADSAAQVLIHVAKLDTDGITNVALETAERTAFSSYINDVKPLGVKTTINYDSVGTVSFFIDVYYDASILNSGGTLISDPSRNIFQEQFDKWVDEEVNAKSIINKNVFKSYIIEGEGINDCTTSSMQFKPGPGEPFQSVGRQLEIDSVAVNFTSPSEPIWHPE